MLLEEVRFKRCRQNLNMCMGSGMWMVNIQLIRVFLDQAHEETLYISVTCDHEHHSNKRELFFRVKKNAMALISAF